MTTARILTGFGHALKSIPLSQLPAEAWRHIIGESYDSSDMITLYERVPWLRRAVDVRASALASMPFAFKRIGAAEELPVGDLPPLPFELDLSALLEQLEGWYVLFGAAYVFARRNRFIVTGLRGLHPNTMRPDYAQDGELLAFKRLIGSMQITLTLDEVGYIWSPNRKHEMGPGAAPALAALAAAGVLKNTDAFAANYFEQAPIAPTLVELPPTAGEADRERVQNWLTRRMSGVANAFKALAVSNAVKFSQLNMIELGKLAVPELTDKKREDVATALGVPQSFLTSKASTNATAEQDDFHFYDKTILPQCRRYEPALNHLFKPLGWQMRFREDQLELYQKLAAAQAVTRVVPLVQQRIITVDEARAEVGYEEMTPEQRDLLLPAPPSFHLLPANASSSGDSAKSFANTPESPIEGESAHATDCQCGACKTARDPVGEARRADKKRFLTVALKRWDEGKFEKAQDFTSEAMGAELDFIKGALANVKERDDISRVFARADAWEGYP